MLEAKPFLKEIYLKKDLIDNYDHYPFKIPSIKNFNKIKFHPDITFIIGENGSGKSTLIEAIALSLGFGSEGGTKNTQFETHNNVSELHKYIKLIKSFSKPTDSYFLRAESFYNVSTYMEETGYLDAYNKRSLHSCSHGEAFLTTITNKLSGTGLYIFDEPEAALSPTRQLSALAAIDNLIKKKSQFIIATHSPILLSYPGALILQLTDKGISQVKYEDTEHFMVTKHFLNNYKGMLKTLLNKEEK